MNQYESILIMPEKLKEDEVEQALDGVKAEVKTLGGEVSSATRMGRRSFARKMHKQSAGEYAFMYFTLDPARVTDLHKALEHNDNVFRIQVIRADKQNTVTTPAAETEEAAAEG